MDHLKEIQNYWDQRSHGFSDSINEELGSEPGGKWTERFRALLGDEPLEILDDGTGPGFFSVLLASLGHSVTSIDYSEKMLERTRQNLSARGLPCTAMQMDAQALAFPDESFDAVVQRDVMWNLDDPAKAYEEICRVLRPGGLLFIDDANHYLAAHDEEYALEYRRQQDRRKAAPPAPGDHIVHNPEQVDYTVIEKIAQEQPLSYIRRPLWDLEQLIRLGFFDLHVTIEGEKLPRHFQIAARKKRDGDS